MKNCKSDVCWIRQGKQLWLTPAHWSEPDFPWNSFDNVQGDTATDLEILKGKCSFWILVVWNWKRKIAKTLKYNNFPAMSRATTSWLKWLSFSTLWWKRNLNTETHTGRMPCDAWNKHHSWQTAGSTQSPKEVWPYSHINLDLCLQDSETMHSAPELQCPCWVTRDLDS